MHIYLIRHGHTPSMGQGLYLGASDEPLAETGRQEIKRLRQQLGELNYQRILVSPLQRARQSAEIFLEGRSEGAEQQVEAVLAERSFGAFERSSYRELQEQQPQLMAAWNADLWGFQPPGGESAAQFYQRLQGFYQQKLLPDNDPERGMLIFTHLGVIRALLCLALGMEREQIWRFAVAPGHCVHLEIDPEGYGFVHW